MNDQTVAPIFPKIKREGQAIGTGPIRAKLFERERAAAVGIEVRSAAPALDLCRALIAAGHDPATPMEVYRGPTLALRVGSIGGGARIKINGTGTGFCWCTAPPASPTREALAAPRPSSAEALPEPPPPGSRR
jgi:hypothetical protein